MFQALRNWFLKKLGHHICEEFTRWQVRRENYVSTHTMRINVEGDPYLTELETPHRFTRSWQERQCTVCGKIEQQSLKEI